MIHSERNHQTFKLEIDHRDPIFCCATVVVPRNFVNEVYHEAARSQQKHAQTPGFNKGNVPLGYIKANFKDHIVSQVKEFLLRFCITSFLREQFHKKKIIVAGSPRLRSIMLAPDQDARFSFEFSIFTPLPLWEWRYLPFKTPKRKNYRDLDRQVEQFIKHEKTLYKQHNYESVTVGDWVHFSLSFTDPDEKPLLNSHEEQLWLKIGNEEADSALHDLFIGKHIGDSFCTSNKGLQECFGDQLNTDYNFFVKIKDISYDAFFDFDQFKKQFRIKNNKDMLQKIVEVFSYRNDMSQRRTIAEESLKLLLSRHRFTVPNHFILRQQEAILNAVNKNPDYHVYRTQRDFESRLKQLAEKQVQEKLLLEQLIYHEKINITIKDVKAYLNLLKRPRTKEFFYFDPPISKIKGRELPLSHEELKHICLREKALNFVIYHLTRI